MDPGQLTRSIVDQVRHAEGLVIGSLRFAPAFQGTVSVAEVVERGGQIGLKADGLLAVRQAFLGFALIHQHRAEVAAGQGQVGIERDRGAIRPESRAGPKRAGRRTEVGRLGQGEIGTQFARGTRRATPGKAAQRVQREAEVVGRFGVGLSQPQGGPAAVNGLLVVAERAVGFGQVGVVKGRIGLQCHRPADQLDGARKIPILIMQHAEKVQGVSVVGLLSEQTVIAACRVGRTPLPVPFRCGDQVCIHLATPLVLAGRSLGARRRTPAIVLTATVSDRPCPFAGLTTYTARRPRCSPGFGFFVLFIEAGSNASILEPR